MSEEKVRYGSLRWLYSELPTCPVCGKEFAPAIEHAWKIKVKNSKGQWTQNKKKVCSYHCMREWEKEVEEERKAKLKEKGMKVDD